MLHTVTVFGEGECGSLAPTRDLSLFYGCKAPIDLAPLCAQLLLDDQLGFLTSLIVTGDQAADLPLSLSVGGDEQMN